LIKLTHNKEICDPSADFHLTSACNHPAYVALDKPQAAERLATRIVAVVEVLRNHPRLGRAGTEPGIRELIIGGTPYVVLYRVRGNRVIISTDLARSAAERVVKGTRATELRDHQRRINILNSVFLSGAP
jgi:toxin ParE1/3/4